MAKKEENKEHESPVTLAATQPNEGDNPVNAIEADKGSYEVLQEFHDIVDFSKVYKVGDTISGLDPKRLTELEEAQLIKKK